MKSARLMCKGREEDFQSHEKLHSIAFPSFLRVELFDICAADWLFSHAYKFFAPNPNDPYHETESDRKRKLCHTHSITQLFCTRLKIARIFAAKLGVK